MLKEIPLLSGYVTARFGKKTPQCIVQIQERRNLGFPTEISRLVGVSEGHLGKAEVT